MLNTLVSISSKLYWMKPIVALCCVICFATFSFSLLDIGYFADETFLIPALAGFIWCVLFFLLLSAFTNIPDKPEKKYTFLPSIKHWFVIFGYKVLAVIFLLMTVAGVVLSFRLFGVWYAM